MSLKQQDDCCVDLQNVDHVKQKMPSSQDMEDLSDFFRVMGSSTRIGILYALMIREEMCVGDLALTLDMTQSTISNQLKLLRQARLIKSRREGKMIYYALSDEHPGEIIRIGMHHMKEEK